MCHIYKYWSVARKEWFSWSYISIANNGIMPDIVMCPMCVMNSRHLSVQIRAISIPNWELIG